ncbi:hypothetical protein ZWY2020_044773 [Hordeum vulgare]|nr:hypothetical protein ZWY2020_044773 [Hordeum vulgare]
MDGRDDVKKRTPPGPGRRRSQPASTRTRSAMPAYVVPLLLLLLCSLVSLAGAAMDPAEREALLRVMELVSSDRDWRSSSVPDPCAAPWPGLECKPDADDKRLMRVTRLDFGVPPNPACREAAAFPTHAFSALPHLQSLFLVDCFKNPAKTAALALPPAANLSASRLQQLSIRSNPSLSGTLPPQLASLRSLQVLTVSQNALVHGEVPRGIGGLAGLVHLDLSYNSLTGPIPARIGELRSLQGLDLSYNSFSGPIPSKLGQLAQLQKLDLSSNNLTGGVPATFSGLKSLTFLALSNNGLSGRLPAGLAGLRDLQYLIMENNPMGVPLPPELGGIARLQELRLANSGYSGSIPDTFGRLTSLTTLSLQNNNLTGRIPAGLSRLKRMYHLNLSKNGLDGAVPFDGAFLRRLGRNLDLSGNPGLCVDDRAVVKEVGVDVCSGGDTSVGRAITRGGAMWPALLRPSASALLCCCLLL